MLSVLTDWHVERAICFHVFLVTETTTKNGADRRPTHKAAVLYVWGGAVCSLAIETVD